ncbi:hypothetical protein SLS62_000908 [Diatrype stigma]|uniref:Uncharacterized protein n=1 Tax=Diatrype stigma TaxID=117547 RepID=A0AAN9V1V7_9PEZI
MEGSSKGGSSESGANRGSDNPLKRRRSSEEYNLDEDINDEDDGDNRRPLKMRGNAPSDILRMEKCLVELREHRQQAEPCEKGTPRQQYGISDEQWAALDKLGRNRKNITVPASMKWMNMWDVISRGQPRPASAYIEETRTFRTRPESEEFSRIYTNLVDRQIKTGNIPTEIDSSVVQMFIELGRISFDVVCSKTGPPALLDGTSSVNTRRPSNPESPITPSRDESDQAQAASQLQIALTSLQQPTKSNPAPHFPDLSQGLDVNQFSLDGISNATYPAPSSVGDGDFHMATLQLGVGDQFHPDVPEYSWHPTLIHGSGQPDEFNPLNGFSQ